MDPQQANTKPIENPHTVSRAEADAIAAVMMAKAKQEQEAEKVKPKSRYTIDLTIPLMKSPHTPWTAEDEDGDPEDLVLWHVLYVAGSMYSAPMRDRTEQQVAQQNHRARILRELIYQNKGGSVPIDKKKDILLLRTAVTMGTGYPADVKDKVRSILNDLMGEEEDF